MPDSERCLTILKHITLDGIHYALLKANGSVWRLGAIRENWQEIAREIIFAPADASHDGVWLAREGASGPDALAVMCCGLGAVWPGMGRELYANFPAARAAMDQIASFADWDLLGLMDETSQEKISQTRWQIPYLFMLEYAQWQQFSSLGLNPALVCGHSLGELIALCVSGVLDARAAWHLLETRAIHVADLEARSGRQGGMLAVPARYEDIEPVLAEWPDLRISNRNTWSQYILGGPREQLLEARRTLRRKRIPAVMLGMDLAFHNPAMRVLRDISVLRLSKLAMRPQKAKMLSCVNGSAYPDTPDAICEAIADLDENAVDWVKLIESIHRDYPDAAYLELGPQEILCGITGELLPGCWTAPSDRKGHEARAMADACARLFAAGFITPGAVESAFHAQPEISQPDFIQPCWRPCHGLAAQTTSLDDIPDDERELLTGLIAERAGMEPASLEPGMELRSQLGLRSASFPFLLLEAEKRLGRQIPLENLFQLDTVADLVRFFAGKGKPAQAEKQEMRRDYTLSRAPIQRYLPDSENGQAVLVPAPLSAAEPKPLAVRLIWRSADAAIAAPDSQDGDNAQDLPCAIIIAAPPLAASQIEEGQENGLTAACQAWINDPEFSSRAPVLAIQRFIVSGQKPDPGAISGWLKKAGAELAAPGLNARVIAWLASDIAPLNAAPEALLSYELGMGQGSAVWSSLPDQPYFPEFCVSSGIYDGLVPEASSEPGFFQAQCQFSSAASPLLSGHGAGGSWSPLPDNSERGKPWLATSVILAAMAKSIFHFTGNGSIAGLHDLRIFNYASLPKGIVREGRIASSSFLSLPLDGMETRHCHVILDMAELTPSGRKNGLWQPLCDCVFQISSQKPVIKGGTDRAGLSELQTGEDALYQLLGFTTAWRRLGQVRLLRDACGTIQGVRAQIFVNPELEAGPEFQAIDGLWQAACFCLAGDQGDPCKNLSDFSFSRLGLVIYKRDQLGGNDLDLCLRLAWSDRDLRRFNAAIRNIKSGEIAMTAHNIEFDWTGNARRQDEQVK